MISALITLLVVALVALVVWYVVGMFITGKPLQLIGIILGLLVLLYGLKLFGIALP